MLDDISFFYKKLIKSVFKDNSINEIYIEDALNQVIELKGVIAVSLLDWENSTILGSKSRNDFNIVDASKSNANMIKIKINIIKELQLNSSIKEILITLTNQIHIINILTDYPKLCLYVALDSNKTNLAIARGKIKNIEEELVKKQLIFAEELDNG